MGYRAKPLIALQGRTVLRHLQDRLAPRLDRLALSVRREHAAYEGTTLPLLVDPVENAGPLAGVLAALDWAASCGAASVLTVPGDTPFIPDTLYDALSPGPACAMSRGRLHPLVALWSVSSRESLAAHLERAMISGERRALSVRHFSGSNTMRRVAFDDTAHDPFFNINTPDDLRALVSPGKI